MINKIRFWIINILLSEAEKYLLLKAINDKTASLRKQIVANRIVDIEGIESDIEVLNGVFFNLKSKDI